jgi:two-component system, NarL family, nitrate/nitrite response regulator NarL
MDHPSSPFRLGLQNHSKNSVSETRKSIVFILSDSRLIRDTLATSLRQRPNSPHIHCVASFAEAVTQLNIAEPGIVLIDATLRDGLSATKWLHLRDPVTRLIAFNIDDATQDVVAWTEGGIVACVHRSASLGEIIERTVTAIAGETIANGSGVILFPRNTQDASSPFGGATDSPAAILTAREKEVVRLIVAGESNKDIARLLRISVPTVKSHVHNLLVKLGLQRRGKLALRYEGSPIAASPHPADRLVNKGAAAPLADPVVLQIPPSCAASHPRRAG